MSQAHEADKVRYGRVSSVEYYWQYARECEGIYKTPDYRIPISEYALFHLEVHVNGEMCIYENVDIIKTYNPSRSQGFEPKVLGSAGEDHCFYAMTRLGTDYLVIADTGEQLFMIYR